MNYLSDACRDAAVKCYFSSTLILNVNAFEHVECMPSFEYVCVCEYV